MSVQVILLDNSRRQQWDEFVAQHPEGEFFHLSGWQQVIEEVYGHACWFYFVEEQGEIVGLLPLAQIKSWLFGNKLISLPFAVSAGVLANNQGVADTLIAQAQALATELKVDCLELRHRKSQCPTWSSQPSHENFSCSLASSAEEILAKIKKKQRAVVRQSLVNGLNHRIESNCDHFFAIYSESVRNLGTPVFPKAYFKALQRVFTDQVDILTVFSGEQAVSSVLSFYYKNQVLPFYGGGTSAARSLKSNDYMYYQLMCHAQQRGMTEFDFGRSKIGSGAHAYKKHWGLQPSPLFYEHCLVNSQELPNISPNNPKYQLFIQAWKKLPLPISRALGPILAKDLG
ncbi:FemAB family PEP-CTERM system-associated protein [Motilimonas cestriensis]|uniref:FemAB family PEP-CTERM system-associated protein n=1 Tax=Motilimonas cestriensis TaxID=2742685 RepID=A0ABS8W5E8_9GAMM|nr:FemAB family XrtA/PEP-CTERM system-associated protein [Motilimonas cestriensis]MCE2594196.1 FemAB family PEP-CTERM system-associated protein [Motilimonas cestriensis]